MFDFISYTISDYFIKINKIQFEDREIFAYGIRRLLLNIFILLCFSIIGLATNSIYEIYVFLLFFVPLRKYAGGFHFHNSYLCFIFSCICVYIPVLISKYINNINIFLLCGIMSSLVIISLAPIQSKNKNLSDNEKTIYKIITKKIIVVYIALSILFYINELILFVKIIILGIIIEAILLFVAKIKYYFINKKGD